MNDNGANTRRSMPRPLWRRLARAMVVYIVRPYVGVCVVLAFAQRSLIYEPTRESRPLTPADAGLARDIVETIRVETEDGLTLNGWHVVSAEEEELSTRWLVLYFHGNAGNRRLRVQDATDFRDVGIDVFLFDYRGYGDNPGRPSESKLVVDARAVWNLALETGYRPERILLYGESLGGGVATRLASDPCRARTSPAGLIVSSTFSSMVDVAWDLYPFLPVPVLLLDRYESAKRIKDVTCPILAVHGEDDDLVPIEFGRRLFAAAPVRSANGIEKRFVAFPHRGHNDLSKAEFTGQVRELVAAIEAADAK